MLAPCGRCRRHVEADASSCPFCGVELRDIAAPPLAVGLLLGLALIGCGEKDDDDDNSASAPSSMTDSNSAGEESTTEDSASDNVDYGCAAPRETVAVDDLALDDLEDDETTGGPDEEEAAEPAAPPSPTRPRSLKP
jgi:hypothetical protein